MPTQKKVNKNFFKKWTPEMAYVIGFFAADGCITTNSRGGQFWSIQITDKELLETIKDTIGAEHKIGIRKKRQLSHKILYRLQIGSIEMCDDLRSLGYVEKKTDRLVLPDIPSKYLSDFVRGYFDGDGSVWVGKMHTERVTSTIVISVAFTSGSFSFLESLQSVLRVLLGMTGSISKRKGKECWCLRYSVRDSLKLYDFMYNSHVQTNRLFLNRKKVVFEQYKEMQS
ncbi:MAG: LAGLIDADG family homing endonuclease [bacterium]